jgi:hypothetical protein
VYILHRTIFSQSGSAHGYFWEDFTETFSRTFATVGQGQTENLKTKINPLLLNQTHEAECVFMDGF